MTWQSGGGGGASYPGVTSDNANGLLVAGDIASRSLAAGLMPNEATDILDIEDGAGGILVDYDLGAKRFHVGGRTILQSIGLSDPELTFTGTGGHNDIDINQSVDGSLLISEPLTVHLGLGVFGHAPPDVPRTLAQSVITAIADANAKTAIQAIANALADSGQLTLT